MKRDLNKEHLFRRDFARHELKQPYRGSYLHIQHVTAGMKGRRKRFPWVFILLVLAWIVIGLILQFHVI